MAYSDSTHFSEQLSYKIIYIPSYGIEDIILASFTHVQQFSENRTIEDFSHQREASCTD
jgi:hypothetical protein